MKESDIRPPDLEAEANRLAQEDIRGLLVRRDEFLAVGCPACGCSEASLQFHKGGFDFQECRRCGSLFVSPRPTAKLLAEYYAGAESLKFWNRCLYPASAGVRKERIFRPRVRAIARLLEGRTADVLVDVGAGFGWFAALCAEEGIARRVIAVEPNAELAASCRKFPGVEVIEAPIEECSRSLCADVITCFELLEHLYAPGEFLRACYAGLVPRGMLVCTLPNWHGFDIAVLRERSGNVTAPNHLNYFTPRSLSELMSRARFGDISITTPGELDVDILRNQLVSGVLGGEELSFWGRVILEGSEELRGDLQRFLQKHGLSSNMMAVARKLLQ